MKKMKREWIETLLEIWQQYCEETGVIKEVHGEQKRMINGDLLAFTKWLTTKLNKPL